MRHAVATRIVAPERAVVDAGADGALDQLLPADVEPTRRRPERRTTNGLGPGVEPQLEGPVVVAAGVAGEERLQLADRVHPASPIAVSVTARSRPADWSKAAASTSSIDEK